MRLTKPRNIINNAEYYFAKSEPSKSFEQVTEESGDIVYTCSYSFPNILLTKSIITINHTIYNPTKLDIDDYPNGVYIYDLQEHEITLGVRLIKASEMPSICASFMIYQSPDIKQTISVKRKWSIDKTVNSEGIYCLLSCENCNLEKSIIQLYSSIGSRESVDPPFISGITTPNALNICLPIAYSTGYDTIARVKRALDNCTTSALITEFK